MFGVTEEAFIVFAANAFALLGLRALYFLVSGLLDRLVYLSTGLSLILAFIGVKLVLHYGHLQNEDIPEIATTTSLVVIAVVLAITVAASLLKSRRDPDARAHAGVCARAKGRKTSDRAPRRDLDRALNATDDVIRDAASSTVRTGPYAREPVTRSPRSALSRTSSDAGSPSCRCWVTSKSEIPSAALSRSVPISLWSAALTEDI